MSVEVRPGTVSRSARSIEHLAAERAGGPAGRDQRHGAADEFLRLCRARSGRGSGPDLRRPRRAPPGSRLRRSWAAPRSPRAPSRRPTPAPWAQPGRGPPAARRGDGHRAATPLIGSSTTAASSSESRSARTATWDFSSATLTTASPLRTWRKKVRVPGFADGAGHEPIRCVEDEEAAWHVPMLADRRTKQRDRRCARSPIPSPPMLEPVRLRSAGAHTNSLRRAYPHRTTPVNTQLTGTQWPQLTASASRVSS